jgi:hypothetical protein
MRFAVALILMAACSNSTSNGLPPATDWNTGDPVPNVETPHGAPNADLHGGGAKQPNPHEGVQGAPPLGDDEQQMPNDTTHAFANGDQAAEVDPNHAPSKDPAAPVDPNKRIKGVFKLGAKVADKVKADGAIFLIVKKADAAGQPTGSALAVDRVTWKGVGQGFELGFEDVTGEVLVMARYDQDLDASTKQPGDVVGMTRVKIPSDNVVLELDTVLP